MRKNYILSLFLLAGIATTALASLEIVWPYGFKQWWDEHPESTHTSIASFGEIPWGRKIIGRMGLANPINACSFVKLDDAADHVPTILVALRGDCPFSMKAHYAQLAGAKLLVIVDNQYEDVDSRLMVDNSGHSETIHIASVLLARTAGDKLIESLNHSDEQIHEIVGRFDFTIPKGDKVSYNLWLSSSSQQTFKFLKSWKQYYDNLKSDAVMIPHFGHFKSYDPVSRTINSDNCVCGTKYCATDPDGDLSNTGRDVLFENLRQICLIKNYGVDTWWKYVLEYNEACLSGGNMTECSRATLTKLKVQGDDIEWCTAKSFDNVDPTQCTTNRLFNAEEDFLTEDGVFLFPSVTINGFGYRGNLVPAKGVFEAVCESFNTMPEVCNQHFEQVGVPTPVQVTKSRGPVVLTAFIFLAIFSVFVFCCYRRYLARTMYKQGIREVNMAVSQYISLKDDEAVRKDSY